MVELEFIEVDKYRQIESKEIQTRIKSDVILEEEIVLSKMSLYELYAVTINKIKASDYQKFRAKNVLDSSLLFLHSHFQNNNINS